MDKLKFALKIIAVILLAIYWCLIVWAVLNALGITPEEFAKVPKYQ